MNIFRKKHHKSGNEVPENIDSKAILEESVLLAEEYSKTDSWEPESRLDDEFVQQDIDDYTDFLLDEDPNN